MAAGILVLAALGGNSAYSQDASSEVPASALQGKKLVYVACSDLNRWCRKARAVIVGSLEAKGVVVTDLQDPYDPVLQAQNLNQAIAQRPDLIVVLATNARSIVPSLRRAKDAEVPVINFVGPTVPESKEYYLASIENNHRQLGEYAATNLVEGLQKEGLETANIMVITGAQVQPEVAVRMDGFNSVLAKYPQYKVVEVQDGNWDQGKSAEIAQTIFAKYRDQGGIQGAFGMADHMAAGIIQAAQQAGIPVGVDNNGLIVVASNCFEIGMVNIAEGLQYGTATQAPEPTAQFAVPLIEKALAGESIPELSLMEESRITRENVEEWKEFCGGA
ncbi:MAG TPA: sugar ABC transporter substrate-binding protein [Bauldia sp.]|nr:sugar ABC transporter substrate-binding protein [Bauldia sp.]